MFALISTVCLSVLTKVKGCSGNVFKVSKSNLAGNAMAPESLDSTEIEDDIEVSKSEAVSISWLVFRLNKKLSKIGKVFEVLIIPPKN